MTSADWAAMANDLAEVRNDNAASIALRRGNNTLAAQTMRIAGAGGGSVAPGVAIQQASGPITILGAVTLDIQTGDRLTYNGQLYEVTFVRSNRRAAIMAQARLIE